VNGANVRETDTEKSIRGLEISPNDFIQQKKEAPMCPIENCTSSVPKIFGDEYQDVQHHLWQHHGLDVVESHRLAATVARSPEPRRYRRKKVVHKKSAAQIEFEKKQMELRLPFQSAVERA
jgi:hypothetical protein